MGGVPVQNAWIEAAKVLPNAITAITAIVGVIIASRGLNRWRLEAIGKRRAELAEDVLADFYEARDAIQAARSPLSSGDEGDTRIKAPDEFEADTRTLNAYYAVAERLAKKAEFFAKLNAKRYRFVYIRC